MPKTQRTQTLCLFDNLFININAKLCMYRHNQDSKDWDDSNFGPDRVSIHFRRLPQRKTYEPKSNFVWKERKQLSQNEKMPRTWLLPKCWENLTIWIPELFWNHGWTPKFFKKRFKKCKKSYFVIGNCKLFLMYSICFISVFSWKTQE